MKHRLKDNGILVTTRLAVFFLFLLNSSVIFAENAAFTAHPQTSSGMLIKAMPDENQHQIETQQDAVYICPMHADEISHQPGSCSQCGMFLVKQVASQIIPEPMTESMPVMDHQQTRQVYACPMHPEESSDKPGSCKKCGMFLVAQDVPSMELHDTGHMHSEDDDPAMHEPAETSSMAGMSDDRMPMQKISKSARFWDSNTTPATTHNHSGNMRPDHPVTERLLPTISGEPKINHAEAAAENTANQQDETYICPMHPQIIQHQPGGHCPICGMNLVAKNTATAAGDTPQVFLSASVIQNMGIRTAKVHRTTINKLIQTQGRVTADDDRLLSIHPRTGGWIEILHLITEGDRIERKDVLVDFYSPWINQVQLEFISALEEYDLTSFDPSRKAELSAKVESLRNSLRLLNVMDMDIMRIKNSRKVQNTIQLMAPQGGIVTRLNINEGSYVEPYQSMFTIVDLSQVWVMVDIYEHQAPWVRKGHKVEVTAPAIPGRSWHGTVDFIYPQVDPKTRTLRARIVLPNPDEALLLNMYVKVNITANTTNQAVLTLPREAVIITGERESVIKVLDKGHFQPVQVTTGKRGEGRVEILSGLQEGDKIVVSGQFLIDSESSLQASFLRMSE